MEEDMFKGKRVPWQQLQEYLDAHQQLIISIVDLSKARIMSQPVAEQNLPNSFYQLHKLITKILTSNNISLPIQEEQRPAEVDQLQGIVKSYFNLQNTIAAQSCKNQQEIKQVIELINSKIKNGNQVFFSGQLTYLFETSKTIETSLSQIQISLSNVYDNMIKAFTFNHQKLSNKDYIGEYIRVFCRIKPMSESELEKEESKQMIVLAKDEFTASMVGEQPLNYKFDSVFGPDSTQREVFQQTKNLVERAIKGYSVSIFAYGQTGSGKTHTIQGNGGDPGIFPRFMLELQDTFKSIKNVDVHLSCYMVELYKLELRDLLLPIDKTQVKLDIKESSTDFMVYIPQTTLTPFSTIEDAKKIFQQGLENRMKRNSQMNQPLSRSHLIFSVIIESVNKITMRRHKRKVSFIDLAGSEYISLTEVDKERKAETKAIKQSLSALGNVLHALSHGQDHIPYRDHPLTMLLKDSLGGTAHTLIIINVSPSNKNESESKDSMKYGTLLKKIYNQIVRNVEKDSRISQIKRVLGYQILFINRLKELILKSNRAVDLQEIECQFKDLGSKEIIALIKNDEEENKEQSPR